MYIFKQLTDFILDILFPRFCFGCRKEGMWLCSDCEKSIKIQSIREQYCPVCHRRSEYGKPCVVCRKDSYLDHLFVLASYENPVVSSLIQGFKYRYIQDVEKIFMGWFKEFFSDYFCNKANHNSQYVFDKGNCVIVPIPIHPRRYRERGFNQAQKLAMVLSQLYHIPVQSDLLLRKRYTVAQAGLSRSQRIVNIRNAFCINSAILNLAKKYILIDDVYSTGITMQECARLLKQCGIREVIGVSLARGDPKCNPIST